MQVTLKFQFVPKTTLLDRSLLIFLGQVNAYRDPTSLARVVVRSQTVGHQTSESLSSPKISGVRL